MNNISTVNIKAGLPSFETKDWFFQNNGIYPKAELIERRDKVIWTQWFNNRGTSKTKANLYLPESYTRAQIIAAFEEQNSL